jgi:Ni,Fe-hydrogenase I cytochrome b subunit
MEGADRMNKLSFICLKIVRWTGWLLLPVVLAFFVTGYAMSGRYGLGALTDETTALTLHKLMHLPLGLLVIVHVVPSVYLALLRWGWIKPRPAAGTVP